MYTYQVERFWLDLKPQPIGFCSPRYLQPRGSCSSYT